MTSLDDDLDEKRAALAARKARIEQGDLTVTPLAARVVSTGTDGPGRSVASEFM